eukprot:TRINITY_DN3994_c0_g2_i1.p1 TRINITY_DN3994_c0_g2~~TRINITY_DN3994_c0_g2_i1.p1  ORF type:complete len:557 (+),score=163.11 TRINITY_DN3994_c0_g2_i1:79-1749(+)
MAAHGTPSHGMWDAAIGRVGGAPESPDDASFLPSYVVLTRGEGASEVAFSQPRAVDGTGVTKTIRHVESACQDRHDRTMRVVNSRASPQLLTKLGRSRRAALSKVGARGGGLASLHSLKTPPVGDRVITPASTGWVFARLTRPGMKGPASTLRAARAPSPPASAPNGPASSGVFPPLSGDGGARAPPSRGARGLDTPGGVGATQPHRKSVATPLAKEPPIQLPAKQGGLRTATTSERHRFRHLLADPRQQLNWIDHFNGAAPKQRAASPVNATRPRSPPALAPAPAASGRGVYSATAESEAQADAKGCLGRGGVRESYAPMAKPPPVSCMSTVRLDGGGGGEPVSRAAAYAAEFAATQKFWTYVAKRNQVHLAVAPSVGAAMAVLLTAQVTKDARYVSRNLMLQNTPQRKAKGTLEVSIVQRAKVQGNVEPPGAGASRGTTSANHPSLALVKLEAAANGHAVDDVEYYQHDAAFGKTASEAAREWALPPRAVRAVGSQWGTAPPPETSADRGYNELFSRKEMSVLNSIISKYEQRKAPVRERLPSIGPPPPAECGS